MSKKPQTIRQKEFQIFFIVLLLSLVITPLAFAHGKDNYSNDHYFYMPTPTPSPSCKPTPTLQPTLQPTPSILQPSDTPTPEVTTTPTPSNNNSTTNTSTSTTQAPGPAVCNIPFQSPVLQGFQMSGNGSVTFSWWGVPNVDKYSIIYGYSPDALVYGEDNIPATSTSLTVNDLTPGNHVWAIVSAWRNGCVENSNLLDPIVPFK